MPQPTPWQSGSLQVLAHRLMPGADLKKSIVNLAQSQIATSGCILTCTGSLTQAVIRLAGASKVLEAKGPFEILALSGTLSQEGVHLHITLSDDQGRCLGGHLVDGSLVATTAELVIGVIPELRFTRPHDAATGYGELHITPA